MAIRALVPNELMRARIGHELENHRHPMPDWLTGLGRSEVEPEVSLLTHVVGDNDELPDGGDPGLGTVPLCSGVRRSQPRNGREDALILSEPLEDLALKVGTTIDDPDQILSRTEPTTAPAVIEGAIDHGSRAYPPLISESWPMCRPLVEWILRQLPAGAIAPEPKDWTDERSRRSRPVSSAHRSVRPWTTRTSAASSRACCGFGTEYATGDPFRWISVTVEMLLDDWFPSARSSPSRPA
jgi:hypothetical protein